MPGLVPQRRSPGLEDEEDDDDISDAGTPNPSKRARLNNATSNGTSSRISGVVMQNTPAALLQEHQPGAIVRVKLNDFVTYTAATFYPGPALNMVIGPNGTGKSTLVCAICIGLAAGTGNLGRAKEVGEYVKHGASDAYIEIELKGHRGKPNQLIKTHIKRDGNKTSFALNGRKAARKEIDELARHFSIQIDNLCQFLPQDRVAEFAHLTGAGMLLSTQRAAAPPEMLEWHEKLKDLRASQRIAEQEQSDAKKRLAENQRKQDQQRVDVERLRERGELVQVVKNLEKLRPMAENAATKLLHGEAKAKKALARAEYEEVTRQVEPAVAALNTKKAYSKSVNDVFLSREKMYTRMSGKAKEHMDKSKALTIDIKTCDTKRQTELRNHNSNKEKLGLLRGKIKSLEAQMREAPIVFDLADMQARLREFTREGVAHKEEVKEIDRARGEYSHQRSVKMESIDRAKKELENMKTRAGQVETMLKSKAPESLDLLRYVRAHKERFDADVYGPPLIECQIETAEFKDQIETLLQEGDIMRAFTAQNQKDYEMINHIVYKELHLKSISIRLADQPLSHWHQFRQRDMPDAQAAQHNFDGGWVIDHISGPDAVLSMLCKDDYIHLTPLMRRECGEETFNSLVASNLRGWFSGKTYYSVMRRREYNAQSTSTKPVVPARFWIAQPVDGAMEADLRDNIAGWQSEVAELENKLKEARPKRAAILERQDAVQAEYEALENEKQLKQQAKVAFEQLPINRSNLLSQVADMKEREAELHSRLDEVNNKETELHVQKGQEAINYQRTIEAIRAQYVKMVTAAIQNIEAQSDLEELERQSADVLQLQVQKDREFKEADALVKRYIQRYKDTLAKVGEAFAQDLDLAAYWEAMSEEDQARTPDELAAEIEARKARLELLQEGDPTMIRNFEDRARNIERLQGKVAENSEGLQELEQAITELRSQWEPRLDELIDRVSEAFGASFQKINCNGEVVILKPGEEGRDFENWAIQPRMSFREGEPLQALDSHRQSGGERAVSTIFYLMALQTLSRAPFRVVDEINQGMDPRNERIVHERMVDIACGNTLIQQPEQGGEGLATSDLQNAGGKLSQYFLITPKLLNGLKYAQGMTVHCIASGEYMPDQKEGATTFAGYLKKKQALNKARAVAVA